MAFSPPNHDHITPDLIKSIHSNFCSIDNMLMLHYSNHSSDPLISKILSQASDLSRIRIGISDLQVIQEISRDYYTIIKRGGELYVRFPTQMTLPLLLLRRSDFERLLLSWLEENRDVEVIPSQPILNFIKLSQPGGIKKLDSPKKIQGLSLGLKNDSGKFKFQQRDELLQQQKSGGLSLLERIKLKEKTSKEQLDVVTPKMKYDKYILGKCTTVYDILHHTQTNAVSLAKLVQVIQDSVAYPLAADEARDTIKLIAERIEGITVVSRGGAEVVKIGVLNRGADLKQFEENTEL